MKLKGKVTWIDVVKPSASDIEAIKRLHKFHPIILDELLEPSARSRVEPHDTYLFLVYHLPMFEHELRTSRRGEVDFLVTRDQILTVHYEPLAPLENFAKQLRDDEELRKRALRDTATLIYYLIQDLINFSLRQMRHIEDNIEYVSREIFAGREEEMLRKISYVKRDILDYSIISEPQGILLDSLLEVGERFWGAQSRIYFTDLIGDYTKMIQRLRNSKEVIESLEMTNAQLLTAKTNKVIRRFTVLGLVVFPVSLIVFLLQIDELRGALGGLPALAAGLLFASAVALGSIVILKRKGWL